MRHAEAVAALAATMLALAAPAAAQVEAGRQLAVRAGVFLPGDATFRDVYGGLEVPVVGQLDWPVAGRVALFGGVRFVKTSGEPISDTGAGNAGTATLSLLSGRAGVLLVMPAGGWDVRVGGGLTLERYDERWDALGSRVTGTRAGWLVQAAAWRRFARRWAAGGALDYAAVKVPSADADGGLPRVDLGGFELTAGIGVRF